MCSFPLRASCCVAAPSSQSACTVHAELVTNVVRGRYVHQAAAQHFVATATDINSGVDQAGPVVVRIGAGVDLIVDMAIAGAGVIHLFEGWLLPHFESGKLEPILRDWWQPFSGPSLYYSSRRLVPQPLHAFLDHIKAAT